MIIFYDLFFSLHIPQATHSFLPGTMLLEAVSEENKRIRCQSPAPAARGISLKGWAVLAGNDVASDSRYGTTCLFQASGSLLHFFKSIRSEVWHFQFPLTQIIVSLLPFKQSFCFRDSLRIVFTCDDIVTHAYLWAAYHIPVYFLSF